MAMSLETHMEQDLIAAMKAQDTVRLSTLRLLKAALRNAAIEKRQEHLADADVLPILSRQIKQRREAIEAYRNGHRTDLAAKEEAELAILIRYEPPQLGDQELQALIEAAMASTGAVGPADQGKVMKQVMAQTQGRADGKRISQLVAERLGRRA